MALGTYAEIQASVASFLHRDDLTTEIKDFIRLAESDLQVRARLSQWETTATVAVTTGSGSLPADHVQTITATYNSDYTLDFLPLAQFNNTAAPAESAEPTWYTIRGSTLLVYPLYTGDIALQYTARFTALSDSATTNSLLTLFPDAYLHGALMHACSWEKDDAGFQKYASLFEADIGRIRRYIADFKYPHGLQMRVA